MSSTPTSWFGSFAEQIKRIVSTITALMTIGAGLYWVFQPHLESFTQQIVGTTDIILRLEDNAQDIEEIHSRINALNDRMEEIAPRRVAEYDLLRSHILNPCAIGGKCDLSYRVRRTAFGVKCDRTSVQAVFEDNAGVGFYPPIDKSQLPRHLGQDWSSVGSVFTVPLGAALGFGEFYFVVDYSCPDEPIPRREISTPLVVEIVSRSTTN